MPIVTENTDLPLGQIKQVEPEREFKEAVSFGEAVSAGFRTENTVASLGQAVGLRHNRQQARIWQTDTAILDLAPDPTYDVFDDIEGYEDYSRAFIGTFNRREAMAVKQKIDRERDDRQTLRAAGGFGIIAAILGGCVDPINLIPIGGTAVRGVRIADTLAKNAGKTAIAGAAGAGLAEVALQGTQITRTAEESLFAVLGGMVLGGVIGGTVGAFVRPLGRTGPTDTLGARLMNSVTNKQVEIPNLERAGDGGGGADIAKKTTAEQESLVGALGLDKKLAFSSPILRTMNTGMRNVMSDVMGLVETPFIQKKNLEGIASTDGSGAVETAAKMGMGDIVEVEAAVDDIFVEMRKGAKRSVGDVAKLRLGDKLSRPAGQLTMPEFHDEIAKAFDMAGAHENPHVVKAAELYRDMFESMGKKAEKLGIIPEGTVGAAVEGGGWYFPVMYDQAAIIAKRTAGDNSGFEDVLAKNLHERAAQYAEELDVVSEDLAKLKRSRAEFEAKLPDNDTLNMVRTGGSDLATAALGFVKRPVSEILKELGGVHPDGVLAQNLKAMDITPKTSPGLFKKTGMKEFDDIPIEDFEIFIDNVTPTADGFVPQDQLIDFIIQEAAGDPARTAEQLAQLDELFGEADSLSRLFDDNDIDPRILTNDQLRQRMLGLDSDELARVIREDAAEGAAGGGATRTLDDLQNESARIEKAEKVDPNSRGSFGKAEMDRIEKLELRAESLRKMSKAEELIEAKDLAREITDTITGASPNKLPDDVVSGPRGPLKERTLDIDPALTRDFRITSPIDVGRRYMRVMSTDMALVKKFGRTDMKDQFARYSDDFAKQRADAVTDHAFAVLESGQLDHLPALEKNAIRGRNLIAIQAIDDPVYRDLVGNAKPVQRRLTEINKTESDTIRDVSAMRDRLRGEFGIPADPHSWMNKFEKSVLALNYLRLLGGMTISAIPDMAMPVFRYGFRAYRRGWGELMGNFGNYKAAAGEMRSIGAGIDMHYDARISGQTELRIGETGFSKFDRTVDNTTKNFGIATLMSPWNAFHKQMSGVVASSWVVDASRAVRAGTATKKQITGLAQMNIDAALAKRIADQIDTHAPKFDSERFLNIKGWADQDVAQTFKQAIVADVDRTILTPTQSRPLWMSKPGWRMVGQFKAFSAEATQAIFISGLQRRDAEVLNGFVHLMVLGALVYKIREERAGREIPSFEEDPGKWFTEAFDRSGTAGWLMDVNNIVEKTTRGKIGASALTGSKPMSRYASRSVMGALVGPTQSLVEDVVTVTGAAFQGEWTPKDSRRLRRLVPFQNALGFKRLFDEAEEGLNSALGVEE